MEMVPMPMHSALHERSLKTADVIIFRYLVYSVSVVLFFQGANGQVGAVTTLAGNSINGNADGTGTSARFWFPSGATVNRAGTFSLVVSRGVEE